ncbi:hypothetical protein ACJX0J_003498, partial [Zea mays]
KAYKLQWIYEKIRFLFEEPLPFANRSNTVADGVLNPFFLISVENFKYGELHLLSKLLQVASVGQSTLTRFYSLHTFVVTCHLDTSLQLRSIFIQYGTSFPYFKYSVFFSLGIFRLLPSESSLDT